MRKFPFLLLLATVAAPALAQSEESRSGRFQRNGPAEQTESRPQRTPTSVQRSERATSQRSAGERVRQQLQRREVGTLQPGGVDNVQVQPGGNDNVQVRRERGDNVDARREVDSVQVRRDSEDTLRVRRGSDGGVTTIQPSTNWRERERLVPTTPETTREAAGPTNWRERERRIRTIPDTNPVATGPSTSEREVLLGGNRRDYRDGRYTRWSDHWRRDRRYDWRHYRSRYGSLYRLGYYYDPFGWNYRHWSIGSFMYPSYYGSSFWLNDPWHYRLPPAYGPYRWVRYWNDALLVNIYTGQVVDIVHGFFW